MYGLEILRHRNGFSASTVKHLREIDTRYPLNVHARVILGIGAQFFEHMEDDVPTYEDRLRTNSDVDSDSETEDMDPL